MIHELYSPDLAGFKTLRFHKGLNILLAERATGSTERQTRNSAGKSSVVDLIHFLLGAEATKESTFSSAALADYAFGMRLDLDGTPVRVERAVGKPSRVRVLEGSNASWPREPHEALDGGRYLKVDDWKTVLGWFMFGLQPSDDTQNGTWPSFRTLISYFARRERDGGFDSASRIFAQQSTGSEQVSTTFLLGLDWTIAQQFEVLRQRGKELQTLKRQVSDGMLSELLGDANELRREVALAEQRVRLLQNNLSVFRVLPEYHGLEEEASRLSRTIQALTNEDALDIRLRDSLQASLQVETESAPDYHRVKELWESAGVTLPGAVARRYEEVQAFHNSVIANRRAHLAAEVTSTERRIQERRVSMVALESRQSQIMSVLKTHGALDQFNKLQEELGRAESRAETLRARHDLVTRYQRLKTELEIEKKQLLLRLQQDLDEQRERLSECIVLYESLSNSLSDHAGTLDVQPTESGPTIKLKTPGDRGTGIRQMQVFCFDMMLARMWSQSKKGPRFLVHDSHLFDGVDERQVASALRVGAQWATEYEFQYIVTMNSDDYRKAFPVVDATTEPLGPDAAVENAVLTTVLEDSEERGGLFGFRFD
jgi:uncharacterized protein YydD (DUF2326 family)